MALTKSTSLSLSSLLIFSLIQAASPHQHFHFLNVSSSLQFTRQVFSPSNQQLHHSNSSSHSLSLTLHSRSSFPSHHHHHHNYTSLTLSRLARDKARVDSLHYRSSQVDYSNRSRCYCESKRPEHLETPVDSGVSEGSGEYFARVGLGRPVKEYSLVLDTGSDVTWLQCQPCIDCYDQAGPVYNPAGSSTYEPLSCSSPQCAELEESSCAAGSCIYEVSYGDGSYTVGNFADETISFGSSGSVPDLAIGCGHDNEGLFSGAAGLMGLGGGSLSLPSQLNATSFSYCLVNRDSTSSSTLDFNSTRPGDSVLATLLINPSARTFRYVDLTGISVGGSPVRFPASLLELKEDGSGGVIVDSGTTVTRLPTEVYHSVRDAFRNMTRNLRFAGGFSLLDTCYDLSSVSKARVPTVSFQFGGGESLVLPTNNYLMPVDSTGTFCFAFAATAESPSIIGNVQQQSMRVSYDLAHRIVGFSPNKC